MSRQRVAIIGAMGSIGIQTLQVLRDAPDRFELVAYAVGRESAAVEELAAAYPGAKRLVGLSGVELSDAILGAAPDLVVAAATGLVGIHTTINALHAGVAVAIANKETVVAGGELVIGAARSAAAQRGTSILERLRPVDSEHSALWQCLAGESVDRVERFWLTASGGPFRTGHVFNRRSNIYTIKICIILCRIGCIPYRGVSWSINYRKHHTTSI